MQGFNRVIALIIELIGFLFFLAVLVKSSDMCIEYSSRIARAFALSEFIAGFFIVAIISVFPEGAVSIMSALEGEPTFGVATVLGSIVADLALVFGIVAIAGKNLEVRSEIIRKDFLYLVLLLLPVVLGVDGLLSMADGIVLIMGGMLFFFTLSIESGLFKKKYNSMQKKTVAVNALIFLVSMAGLLLSAHFLVIFASQIAEAFQISVALIGMLVVAVGTCTPEMFFSIRAVKTRHEELAFGDILGTVITDATVLLGVTAVLHPVFIDSSLLLKMGAFMFIGGLLLIWFIKTGKTLTRREGIYLVLFYLLFVLVQILLNT